MSYLHLNQPLIVSNIDKLVKGVLFNHISFEEIKKQLNDLYEPFMDIFDDGLFYSETIHAFIDSTESIMGDSSAYEVVWDHDKTQRFINTLLSYKNDIEEETRAWRYNEGQNKNNLVSLVRNLTDQYSKLLFVMVDLKYATETSHHVTIDRFNDHMKKIRELISNKKTCFEHVQGYAWALEQGGKNGGLHCHLLLIYNGSERQRDGYLGKAVGEKWQSITGGLGTYYNWNTPANKQKYADRGLLGIGMIHRDNPLEVENSQIASSYLAKTDKCEQQLKLWLPGMRTFGQSRFNVSWRRGIKR
ncbi:inovirus Gp2 family protein [Psychrobacter sp. ANT_H56B]|uniref:YagK/YfjJ domain-containing protein n=1 Tax=Psychrobacter sp. ANT_H56B TaxID=2597353 RepID=UPI0011F143FB|nr:inovirus-type Gp2 protein [Psychrobacter sp. ANT_H56B]KAA0929422.1 inovirus Gp2 family protein [Psychrobacter sp. ANT_H56B]